MAGLRFLFVEMIKEIQALKTIARDFLDSSTTYALDQLKNDFDSAMSASCNTLVPIELRPLRTIVSKGDYEAGRRQGGPHVYAVITGIWDVRPLGQRSKKEKARQKRQLEFCGIASTKIEIYDSRDQNQEDRLAMWRIELGGEDAPGCYFHVQILGEATDPPFPSTVPVPRLPSIFITPMGAIEYVLGELFQDRWAKAAQGNTDDRASWRDMQRERLRRLFSWQVEELKKSLSSPWMTLKAARPKEDLFLR